MKSRIYSLNVNGGNSLGIEFDPKDEHDNFVLENIMFPSMNLSTEAICFEGNKEENEKFTKAMFHITEYLFKANSQRRQYFITEKKLAIEHFERSKKDKNKADLRLKPIDLTGHVDSLLSNLKASLDEYSKVFNLFFGLSLHGWHKKMDEHRKEISGQGIINKLTNISKEKNVYSLDNLIEFIEKNKLWITYLVKLRDDFNHFGGIKSISDIIYRKKTNKIENPNIKHPDNNQEELGQFLNRTVPHFNMFVNSLLMLSLQARAPFMILQKTINQNGSVEYGWGIPKNKIKKRK